MRRIYLIRHGAVAFPQGEKICFSRMDLPLSKLGELQAICLKFAYFSQYSGVIVHSPLMRTKQTAETIGNRLVECEEIAEIKVGDWEGLTFDEIRRIDPKRYLLRGEDPAQFPPPNGESFAQCLARSKKGLKNILEQTEGDVVIVAHAGVNRILLCDSMERPLKDALQILQPYGCVNRLLWDGQKLTVEAVGELPQAKMDRMLCVAFREAVELPQKTQAHCDKVAEVAVDLAKKLNRAGMCLDIASLQTAAWLHDLAKGEKDHAQTAAWWMEQLGYAEIARMICLHHELPKAQSEEIDEATVLYFADKLVWEDQIVSLEERFAKSFKKCQVKQAQEMHQKRFEQAQAVKTLIWQKIFPQGGKDEGERAADE